MKRIHKISRVRTIGGRRKAFRNIFRKNRGLIGKGYRKVAGKKILKKMSAKERKKFNPKTNLKIRQSLRKRKIKHHQNKTKSHPRGRNTIHHVFIFRKITKCMSACSSEMRHML